MYFVFSGRLRYSKEGDRPKTWALGQWISEGVLWTQWVHFGTMSAKTDCCLVLLDAAHFQSIATRFQTQEFYPKQYAERFVKKLNGASDRSMVSDLENPGLNIEEIC